jgi:hypothetical protein
MMPAQKLNPVGSADIDFAPLIEACAASRAAFMKAKKLRSERPDRLRAAKAKLADAEFRRDATQLEADAGADVDATRFALLDAEVVAAQADLDAANRGARAEAAAIEALRGRLSEARIALFRAIGPQREAALKIAEARYLSGVQMIKDAVTIAGKLKDEMLPVRMRILDFAPGTYVWDQSSPSPEIVELLLEIDPALREIDSAQQQVLR